MGPPTLVGREVGRRWALPKATTVSRGMGAMAADLIDGTPWPCNGARAGQGGPPILCGEGRAVVGDGHSPEIGRP
jgi:hypothetical protein